MIPHVNLNHNFNEKSRAKFNICKNMSVKIVMQQTINEHKYEKDVSDVIVQNYKYLLYFTMCQFYVVELAMTYRDLFINLRKKISKSVNM